MSYFRGLGAEDPWADAGSGTVANMNAPGILDTVTSAIGKLFAGATAPATAPIGRPAPLTAAEQAKILGAKAGASATVPVVGQASSKLPLILGVGVLGAVTFMLLHRPRANPARRRRGRR